MNFGVLAEQGEKLPLDRLDPKTRSYVLAALAGLFILWFAVVVLIWLGARVTRRYMGSSVERQPCVPDDDWATKPLASGDEPEDRGRE